MKKIYKILIIIIVVTSVFLYRDTINNIYEQGVNYLGNRIFLFLSDSNTTLKSKNKSQVKLIEIVSTPTPLKLKNSIPTSNQIKLSSKEIIKITNQFRIKDGKLALLKENSKLDLSAKKKIEDMFNNQYFEHTSPTGIGVSDLAKQVSYQYIIIGENLALGNFKNSKALVDAWMASPPHRKNILNKYYTEIGVAVGKGFFKGEKIWLAVQHFGLPKNVCPAIKQILLTSINSGKKQIKIMEDNLSIRREKIQKGEVYEDLTVNEQIDKYNSLIIIYNQLVLKLKKNIIEYNKEAENFNSCVMKYTISTKK